VKESSQIISLKDMVMLGNSGMKKPYGSQRTLFKVRRSKQGESRQRLWDSHKQENIGSIHIMGRGGPRKRQGWSCHGIGVLCLIDMYGAGCKGNHYK
jgi:hypothetical protein